MNNTFSRRDFMAQTGKIGVAAAVASLTPTILTAMDTPSGKAAILGGTPISGTSFSGWPVREGSEVEYLTEIINQGRWGRLSGDFFVERFEQEYSKMCGAKHCITTNGGTTALVASLGALEIGPYDEVITSPYTFIATINSVLSHFALPIPVDVDLESFQLDPAKVDAACTDNTACLMPVHIGGYPADMDAIMEISGRRNIPVIEDACQAHLGRWRDKYLGTIGLAGCFSFQASKNLTSGEGGAVFTNDDVFAQKVFMIHNNNGQKGGYSLDFDYGNVRGSNFRMTEFQGAVLCAQIKLLEKFAKARQDNGVYLNKLLADVPGIHPAKLYPHATQSAWHLYMFRIVEEEFGLSRQAFIKAMAAEGLGIAAGYGAMNWADYVRDAYSGRAASRLYPKKTLDDYVERIGSLPMFERLAAESLWVTQTMMLGPRKNMDIIAEAIWRVYKNAAEIAKLNL